MAVAPTKQELALARDLFNRWLNVRQQGNLQQEVNARPDYPAYGLSSSDAMKYLSAEGPFDLWRNEAIDPRAYQAFDYPTSGLNVKDAPWAPVGRQENAVFITERDDLKAPLHVSSPDNRRGIYAHELGHYRDTRTNPSKMWSFPNKGLVKWQGLEGGLLQREFPALVAEAAYWERQEQTRSKNAKR